MATIWNNLQKYCSNSQTLYARAKFAWNVFIQYWMLFDAYIQMLSPRDVFLVFSRYMYIYLKGDM